MTSNFFFQLRFSIFFTKFLFDRQKVAEMMNDMKKDIGQTNLTTSWNPNNPFFKDVQGNNKPKSEFIKTEPLQYEISKQRDLNLENCDDQITPEDIEQVIAEATQKVNESNLTSQIELLNSQLNPRTTVNSSQIQKKYQSIIADTNANLKHPSSVAPLKKSATINEAQKLYFARLRVRLMVHKKVYTYLKSIRSKSPINAVIQFLVLKHGCFLYDELIKKLHDTDPFTNPFMFEDKQAWVEFTESDVYLSLLKYFWQDAEELLAIFDKE